MISAIAGINWGDEGKGRMVDLLGEHYDIIVRYQGGNNAGHTVINEHGKFILNLLPSGILRESTVNVMGVGMVIDLEHLCKEIGSLTQKGVRITPKNLKISDKAVICLPFNKEQDILEEERLKDKKFGSTRRGIAPIYADKFMKKAIRMGDLFKMDTLAQTISELCQWKNLTFYGYKAKAIEPQKIMDWLNEYRQTLLPYVCDTGEYLYRAVDEKKNIMFEAQLGALRDIDYGIYPYTSSSYTLSSYATLGAGIPGVKLDETIGIIKAYSSCVGEGPFTAELFGDIAQNLREAGGEFGAATGRPRRVGGFDVVASRYGVKVQAATTLALTKLDILEYLDKIPVCTGYELDGKKIDYFPSMPALNRAKPVYEYMDGFGGKVSNARKLSELPPAALKYVKFIQEAVGCPIEYISVGAERSDIIVVGKNGIK